MNRYWIMLLIAAGLEIAWAIGLKYTEGFTRLWSSVGTVLAMAASMYLLARTAGGFLSGRPTLCGRESGLSAQQS